MTLPMSPSPLPLAGIKVADFSQGVAGPHASFLLANQGAEVIKIEPPEGDWGRNLGKRFGNFSAFSVYYNRGKRSLALDLKQAKAREIAFEMAATADVVVESFRPGVMARLGLDPARLFERNPKLVYLAVTGFGQNGPNADLPATDAIIQGYSGLMSLNKDAQGVPQRFPMILIDVVSGIYGAQAIMAGLMRVFRFGKGQYIDCNLMQCATALQAPRMLEFHLEGGNPEIMYVPLGVYATKDSFLSLSVNRDAHFAVFFEVLGRPDIAHDPRYAARADRVRHADVINAIVREKLLERTSEEWSVLLGQAGILHSKIRSYSDILGDPEIVKAGHLTWLDHPDLPSPVPIPNVPGAFPAEAFGSLTNCPEVGQHTEEVLAEQGLSREDIQAAIADGVACTSRRQT
ncbi:CaiB/BaiF CoA transferase family protein [Ottowia thiooxydans]|uniref:Crotonobetainyl-CoA:carnitine CoA-transferase CaiB-like acyl-CoA transferase n=1 Tax=Ottowia thiooxydans TaxID=219182 RepID=A0ABV2Q9A9_9BURK